MNRLLVGLAATALLASGTVIGIRPTPPALRVTIHLRSAVGVYVGSEVRVVGVRVGKVVRVVPEGPTVRVELEYERRHQAPADAIAVVVRPTLAGERYVQLAPAYRGGPTLPDGAELPVERTAVPADLDEVLRGLDSLGTALGPTAANSTGSLSRLIATGRRNLEGNGDALSGAITGLSGLAKTATDGNGDYTATVRNLQTLTSALAANDEQVRDFTAGLARVSDQLDGGKGDLVAAVRTLSVALAQLAAFVRENGTAIRTNVEALTALSAVLIRQKDALAGLLTSAPEALAGLERAYDPATGSLAVRDRAAAAQDPTLGGVLDRPVR